MLEKNQRFKSLLFVLLDAALLFVGFLLAPTIFVLIMSAILSPAVPNAAAIGITDIITGLATSLVLVLIYWVAGIYNNARLHGLAERCTKLPLSTQRAS